MSGPSQDVRRVLSVDSTVVRERRVRSRGEKSEASCIYTAMKLYTRRGDEGRSRINGPGDLHKSEEIFEALGAVDEANSFLGLARQTCKDAALKDDHPGYPGPTARCRFRPVHSVWRCPARRAMSSPHVRGRDPSDGRVDRRRGRSHAAADQLRAPGDLDPFRYETSDYAGYYGSKDVPAGVFPPMPETDKTDPKTWGRVDLNQMKDFVVGIPESVQTVTELFQKENPLFLFYFAINAFKNLLAKSKRPVYPGVAGTTSGSDAAIHRLDRSDRAPRALQPAASPPIPNHTPVSSKAFVPATVAHELSKAYIANMNPVSWASDALSGFGLFPNRVSAPVTHLADKMNEFGANHGVFGSAASSVLHGDSWKCGLLRVATVGNASC
eukprot:jgi/Mesvir1/5775/Mv22189-RA.1